MDDLQPIATLQGGMRPIIARHDRPVALHRYALSFHVELGDQIAERQTFLNSLGLAIDDELHGANCGVSNRGGDGICGWRARPRGWPVPRWRHRRTLLHPASYAFRPDP